MTHTSRKVAVLHTYTVITKNFTVLNLLQWQEAADISNEGDLILTVKDNNVTAVRTVSIDEYNGIMEKSFTHMEKSIIPDIID